MEFLDLPKPLSCLNFQFGTRLLALQKNRFFELKYFLEYSIEKEVSWQKAAFARLLKANYSQCFSFSKLGLKPSFSRRDLKAELIYIPSTLQVNCIHLLGGFDTLSFLYRECLHQLLPLRHQPSQQNIGYSNVLEVPFENTKMINPRVVTRSQNSSLNCRVASAYALRRSSLASIRNGHSA